MANEFIARNGLIAQTDSKISGSLTQGVPGNIASGSYSHAEGGGTALGTSIDISTVSSMVVNGISLPTVNLASTTIIEADGDMTAGFPSPSFTITSLTLTSGATTITPNLSQYDTAIVSSYYYDEYVGSNGTTYFNFTSNPLEQVYSSTTLATNTALGAGSHAEGLGTVAKGDFQHVQGQFNITSSVQSAFIHGNGTSDSARSNLIYAHDSTVEVTGSLNITGSLLVNGVAPGGGSGFPYSGSAVITGSLLVSGSGLTVTGSVSVNGSITGSLFGTSSFAISSSRAATASFARYPFITTVVTGNISPAGSLPSTDYIYLVSGSFTVTLPTAVGNTSRYDIKNIRSGSTATIATTSTQTIDGSLTATLPVQYTSLTLVSDNVNWHLI